MIDFRSDTVTKPSPAMLEAMFSAKVGDDVFGEDPTINELEDFAAAIFGMEASLFCPSGTMTNQIAIKCHTQPGDEVICDRLSHIYQYEGGGIAFNSGCSVNLIDGNRGLITANDVIGINLDSVFNMTKQVIKPMMKAKKGSIINMSSIIGIRGNAGQASYAASKAGVIGFTKSVALELGSRNIRCNAIAPGFIETDMTHYLKEGDAATAFLSKIPLARFGKGEEVADVTLFLASEMSSYITGQVISTCGGLNI